MPDLKEKLRQEIDREILEFEYSIYDRYELLHVFTDYSAATLFLVGSLCMLNESWHMISTWLFIIGSLFFFGGAVIRTLSRHYDRVRRQQPHQQRSARPTNRSINW